MKACYICPETDVILVKPRQCLASSPDKDSFYLPEIGDVGEF